MEGAILRTVRVGYVSLYRSVRGSSSNKRNPMTPLTSSLAFVKIAIGV